MTALGLGLLAALCWGLHDITIRYLSRSVPLKGALFCVLLAGLTFQTAVVVGRGDPLTLPGAALALSVGSGLAFLGASLGLYHAFARGPVRLVSPIIGAFPILSLGFAALAGAQVGAAQLGAVLAVIVGVGLVAALADPSTDEDIPPRGRTIVLSLGACLGFALTFKLGQMAAELAPETTTTLVARITALGLLGLWMLRGRLTVWPGRHAIAPLAIMGLLDGVALLAVISAARLERPEYAAVASSMFGLLTIVLAWAFLRERMGAVQWAGCGIAFVGIGYLATGG